MEPNQISTYNIASSGLNDPPVLADISLSSTNDCYIGTLGTDSITSAIYDYYQSTPDIIPVPGTNIIFNGVPYSLNSAPHFDFSSIVYGDCFRLKSNRRHLKLEFCL